MLDELLLKDFAAPDAGFSQVLARAFAPRKHLTVSEWSDKNRRLSKKGSAEPGPWRTDRNPPLREPMDCLSSRSTVKDIVLMFPIQKGKALAIDTPIPTPNGWKSMGELKKNDFVFDEHGKPCSILVASGVFLNHKCYRVSFSDGSNIIADAGHKWTVDNNRHYHRIERETITTKHIANTFKYKKNNIYAVYVAGALDLPDVDLPIDPYTLGVWLGDGNSSSAQFTKNKTDAPHFIEKIQEAGYSVVEKNNGCRALTLAIDPKGIRKGICHRGHVIADVGIYKTKSHGRTVESCAECGRQNAMKHKQGSAVDPVINPSFYTRLNDLGVLNNKHIPVFYLRASIRQRFELLHGLMDTDGHIGGASGRCEISSSYPALAKGIIELITSLGLKPTSRLVKTTARDARRISFMVYDDVPVFTLPRKLSRQVSMEGRRVTEVIRRRITNVETVPTVPTRCIAVNSPNHLFLAGKAMIPTHNTEVAINVVGYTMEHNPGPLMVCLPTEVSMNKWINQKLNPMLEETESVKNTLTSIKSREAANTRTFKDYLGGQLYLEHAGSPSRLKSTSVRTLIVDELDEFAANMTSGDDPVDMLLGRTSAFPSTYKRLFISTPQIKGVSRTESMYEKSDKRRFYLRCPHCRYEQHLEWAGLQWGAEGKNPRYVCKDCGTLGTEIEWKNQIISGRWIAENPTAKMRGYHINGLYYQIGLGPRWEELVSLWLEAQNDQPRLKTFINDRLAEAWEDPVMRAVKFNIIADRAEPYKIRLAPRGVCAITAGVDTQDNRLAVHIVGWGKGLTAWSLDYIELMGDPADDAVWVSLTELLNKPIELETGGSLRVMATAIDAGGHRTEAVKNYVRIGMIRRPMVIFGAVPNNAPVLSRAKAQDVNWRGRLDRRGVHIQHVGTVAIKHLFYGRLSTDGDKERDQRQLHFSDEFDTSFFAGLTSETFDPRKNRFINRRGARNEPLDCWVYAYAAAHHQELRLQHYTNKKWDELLHKQEQQEKAVTAMVPVPASKSKAKKSGFSEVYAKW